MSAEEKIWEAVEEAINAGITVDKFFRIVREAWPTILRDAATYAAKEIDRMTRPPLGNGPA